MVSLIVYSKYCLDAAGPNHLLNARPPHIHEDEATLSRRDRTTLSRFRSGHHPGLNTFENKINRMIAPQCDYCPSSLHTVKHLLLNCHHYLAKRQQYAFLGLEDLWYRPLAVASFLGGGLAPIEVRPLLNKQTNKM